MMSDPIHNSWTIARSAILSHQHRMSVTANNIANIDTPGYTRRITQLATTPETPPSIQDVREYSKGTGVMVADIVRAQSGLIRNLLCTQAGDTAGHQTRADALGHLEALIGSNGLEDSLNAFWNAWADVANQADNVAARNVVIQRGVDLASHLNSLNGHLVRFEGQVLAGVPGSYTGQLAVTVNRFNELTAQLQDLNTRITYSLSGNPAMALMDRRDQLMLELCEMANITIGPDYSVSLDGQLLVSANGAERHELEISAAGPPVAFEVDGNAVQITSGRISGWADVYDIAGGMRDRLDMLAAELMDAINDIYNSDRNLDGDTFDLRGERVDWDFFVGTDAASIAVNTILYDPADPLNNDPWSLGAAATRYDDGPPPSPNVSDGARALQIAALASSPQAALNGQTLGGFHTTGLSLLGGMVASERRLADDGAAIIGSLKDALQAEVGVNMDEELMDMLMAQRAFQAASRLLQAIDELMVTIIQR